MLGRLFAALGYNTPSTTASAAGGGEQSASALIAEYVAGWHVVTIDGYSAVKAVVGTGKFVASRPFTVGGHRWYIKYFPNGEDPDTADYLSLYLVRERDDAGGAAAVPAWFRFVVLGHGDDKSDEPWQDFHKSELHMWKADGSSEHVYRTPVPRRWQVERSAFLMDDSLRVRCDVVVVTKEITATAAAERDDGGRSIVDVPPPDVGLNILQMLWDGEGSDVTFEVAGETFRAHRCILAARSPVFMAALYGPMMEATEPCVRIDDMEAEVFKLLLNFVYTDWLPEMDESVIVAMSQHLLVAADRYGLERLKLFCEHNLCCRVNVSTVASSLALAERHGCQGLKKVCVQFLKSGSNLKAAMATDGFEHLTRSYPSVFEELLAMVAA